MSKKHVLVIEDDADIREVLTTILTEDGYGVTTREESDDVIKEVLEIGPDLIITDYILQGINGGEYCSAIKKDERTAHLPVIILSGFGKVLHSLGDYQADMIIDKPFDNAELLQEVAKLTRSGDRT